MESRQCVHVTVAGRVQGVGFRAAACAAAERLGLVGWVRNLPDGSVEALAEGPPEAVRLFVAWCQHGPNGAHVDSLATAPETSCGAHDFFIAH